MHYGLSAKKYDVVLKTKGLKIDSKTQLMTALLHFPFSRPTRGVQIKGLS